MIDLFIDLLSFFLFCITFYQDFRIYSHKYLNSTEYANPENEGYASHPISVVVGNVWLLIIFNDLINICNSKKEVELKYELETNVNLINFKNGYIEISFNENLKKDFVKILSSKLYEWTNTRWIISLSQNKGQETIKKTSEGEKKNNLKDFEQTDIFNNLFE